MSPLLMLLSVLGAPAEAPPQDTPERLCAAASRGMIDMRWDRGGTRPEYVTQRLERCAGLVRQALREGLRVEGAARVVAVAYNESNFRPGAVGAKGELGMLQIIPRLHCWRATRKDGTCDPELAGIRYLRALQVEKSRDSRKRRRKFDWAAVLTGYNGSSRYGDKVDGYARSALKRYRYRLKLRQRKLAQL